MHKNLFPSSRKAGVSSDASLEVEFAFTVAAEVDGSWSDMDVHQVVDNSALDVVNDPVHQVTTAHVHDLYKRHVAGRKAENTFNNDLT